MTGRGGGSPRGGNCLSALLAQGLGAKPFDDTVNMVAEAIVYHGVDWLAGDFNMGAFAIMPALRAKGIAMNLAGRFAWRRVTWSPVVTGIPSVPQAATTHTGAVHGGSSSSAAPAQHPHPPEVTGDTLSSTKGPTELQLARQLPDMSTSRFLATRGNGEVHHDSLLIFTCRPANAVVRLLPDEIQDGTPLLQFPKGQGYPIASYIGGARALRETLVLQTHETSVIPLVHQKPINYHFWDCLLYTSPSPRD